MHIMEGFLPVEHALGWSLASAPFVVAGVKRLGRQFRENPSHRMLVGVAAAFTFVLSALKLPSVTGSSSHPTGTGLGAVLFGPVAMVPVALVVLLFQALLLAHGGLTTLGANVFSMGVVGPLVAAWLFALARKLGTPVPVSIFVAAAMADLATYLVTSFQLALAFPDPVGGFTGSLVKFLGVFALTQLPLAVSEGLLSVVVFNLMRRVNHRELSDLKVVTPREVEA